MATTATKDAEVATVLSERWTAAAKKFTELAAALPDPQLESELVSGARPCGGVLRHVAYWNRYVADSLNGKKADDSANELRREEYPGKAQVLNELGNSSREITGAASRKLDARSMELIGMALEHLSEHYGQLVVYARLMGVIPPVSRPQERG